MKRKWIGLFLSAVMAMTAFTGCGTSDNGEMIQQTQKMKVLLRIATTLKKSYWSSLTRK